MPARTQEPQFTQVVISVSEMARRLTLSRARFYELIKAGVFPPPSYCPVSRRAMYPIELQQQCLAVRDTNVGANGQYVIFNRSRGQPDANQAPSRSPRGRQAERVDPLLGQLREGLASLGMVGLSDERLHAAIRSAYPSGIAGIDPGAVLASVFRLLRVGNQPANSLGNA